MEYCCTAKERRLNTSTPGPGKEKDKLSIKLVFNNYKLKMRLCQPEFKPVNQSEPGSKFLPVFVLGREVKILFIYKLKKGKNEKSYVNYR